MCARSLMAHGCDGGTCSPTQPYLFYTEDSSLTHTQTNFQSSFEQEKNKYILLIYFGIRWQTTNISTELQINRDWKIHPVLHDQNLQLLNVEGLVKVDFPDCSMVTRCCCESPGLHSRRTVPSLSWRTTSRLSWRMTSRHPWRTTWLSLRITQPASLRGCKRSQPVHRSGCGWDLHESEAPNPGHTVVRAAAQQGHGHHLHPLCLAEEKNKSVTCNCINNFVKLWQLISDPSSAFKWTLCLHLFVGFTV